MTIMGLNNSVVEAGTSACGGGDYYWHPYTYPTTTASSIVINQDVWAVWAGDPKEPSHRGLTIYPSEIEALRAFRDKVLDGAAGVKTFRVVFGALIPVGGERRR